MQPQPTNPTPNYKANHTSKTPNNTNSRKPKTRTSTQETKLTTKPRTHQHKPPQSIHNPKQPARSLLQPPKPKDHSNSHIKPPKSIKTHQNHPPTTRTTTTACNTKLNLVLQTPDHRNTQSIPKTCRATPPKHKHHQLKSQETIACQHYRNESPRKHPAHHNTNVHLIHKVTNPNLESKFRKPPNPNHKPHQNPAQPQSTTNPNLISNHQNPRSTIITLQTRHYL